MKRGDILGHEFMGEVVETGPDVRTLAKGDRAPRAYKMFRDKKDECVKVVLTP